MGYQGGWTRAVLSVALAVAAAGAAQAQQPPNVIDGELIATPEVVKAACAEGQVTYYTSQSEADERDIIKPFEKAFPCVRVSVISIVTGRLYERVRTEAQAGVTQADALTNSSEILTEKMVEAKLGRDWVPPSADNYPDGSKHQGYWYASVTTVMAPFYNTQIVQGADVPTSWRVLVDPKWSGRIGASPITIGGTGWLFYAFIKEKFGLDFVRAFAAQRPRMFTAFDPTVLAVARGELAVGVVSNVNLYNKEAVGAPIRTVFPEEGVPFVNLPMMLVAGSPHPNAALLFGNWYLSRQGQASVVRVRGAYSARRDVAPAPGNPPLDKLNIWRVPLKTMMEQNDAFVAEITNIFK